MEEKIRLAVFGQKRLSREGGILLFRVIRLILLKATGGGIAAGSIAFLIGQYCAPKIKSNQKYNMKSLLILFMMWIFRKLLWKTAPTKLDVLYYMLLGIIGVFIWPIVFEKIRSRRWMNLLKRMGGISLELYLTNIFRWKINGMSNQGIADRLNAEKVPSPAARKLQSGAKLSLHFRKSDEPPWSAKAVDRILHNEVYIGKLVQGKTRRLDYRSKKKMNVPMRDWVIVDNTHEAIIPAEQFELVQRILETETRRPNDAETVALFAGFLYCGDCGSRLVRRSASYKGKRYIYYQCSGSKQNKGSCTSHNLRDEKLHNIVRNALQMQIQIVMEEAEFVESIRQAQQEPYRVRRIERQIRQLTAEKAHTQGIKEKLYGDYAEEILTREDFLNYNELYSKRIEEYDRKITELEAERQNLQTAPNAYPFLDVYRKYRKLEEITRPMVVELIEKIEVYEGNRVEITFRFHDEIADLLEELHQKQMGQREVSA